MYDEKKVERVNELVRLIKDAEAELTGIFGGEPVKKTWSRRPKPEQEGNPA
jgi:hypothetical protein